MALKGIEEEIEDSKDEDKSEDEDDDEDEDKSSRKGKNEKPIIQCHECKGFGHMRITQLYSVPIIKLRKWYSS